MSDLRKAAQDFVNWYDYPWSSSVPLETMVDTLRAALATCPDCGKPTPEGSVRTCSPQKPDSGLASLIESLIGEYWDIAHEEGKTGISQGDLANQVLGRIRSALILWAHRAAPTLVDWERVAADQALTIGLMKVDAEKHARDAARFRWLRDQGDDLFVELFDTEPARWSEIIDAAMQQEQKK